MSRRSTTTQVKVLFMVLLMSILALHHGVSGARLLLHEKMEDLEKKVPAGSTSSESSDNIDGDQGFFATVNREVPSCPDPLHNR
ncbi:CLAVATA3/ESR-RELATED [Parasponia andersonii]|uniref:CLAVATA3/ESR-RELATED n=1 Tax=Parasponia andersonii TaxID=3476 RepID=A0A2P5DSX3_PARAD|nr:CLAVATA3/ESR-RELATED [Parasponia andersonii]